MKEKWKIGLKENALYMGLSFLLPIIIMGCIYASIGIYPGSEERTVLASDAFSQYSNFHASFNHVLKGNQSIFYTWNASMGLNYWSFMSYYLGGIFTPLVFFVDNLYIADYLYFLTLLKIGCLGVSFWLFASQTFQVKKWNHLVLSISYALMSFVIAFSEIVMWFDGLIYLPLVILGIHRVMDKKKSTLLFISYFFLFISNFYIAFMVGLFSFLYFIVRLCTDYIRYVKTVSKYLLTTILAIGASMPVILPTILDLKNNGESLSPVTQLLVKETSLWNLIIKNMIGVYDTTKFGSIPYVYIGLYPLILGLFYFISKKISLRDKICYGTLLILLVVSFYIEPLNLFWQGMHTPNMFLFRYSFLFSFLVLLLAGYAWEKLEQEELERLVTIILGLLFSFICLKIVNLRGHYFYISSWSFIWTYFFLAVYLMLFLTAKKKKVKTLLAIMTVLIVSVELAINGRGIVSGIANEWHYPAKHFYTESYSDIKKLVDQTKKENTAFYRLENLDAVTANDGFNYGYSGISMFSSIRNRHSSIFLNALGYRSLGTNLNIRYANNTLLMDSLVGMKYNLSKEPLNKFGYSPIGSSGNFTLYENKYAIPLGVITDGGIYEQGAVQSQASLFNYLAKGNEEFFSFKELKQINSKNVKIKHGKINRTSIVTYEPKKEAEMIEIEWEAIIPARKQAYFSFYPTNYTTLGNATLTLEINGVRRKTGIYNTGQYYSLGFFEKETRIHFKTILSNLKKTDKVEVVAPEIALMDTDKFKNSFEKIKERSINLSVNGRKVKGTVDLEKEEVLLTTIPYDKGWTVSIDGKKQSIKGFKEALLTVTIPAGKHLIEFVYLPQGFLFGGLLGIFCIIIFVLYRKNMEV